MDTKALSAQLNTLLTDSKATVPKTGSIINALPSVVNACMQTVLTAPSPGIAFMNLQMRMDPVMRSLCHQGDAVFVREGEKPRIIAAYDQKVIEIAATLGDGPPAKALGAAAQLAGLVRVAAEAIVLGAKLDADRSAAERREVSARMDAQREAEDAERLDEAVRRRANEEDSE